MGKINVLYEDNHIIVVEKPFNVLSQQDNTNDLDMLTLVKGYIKEKYNKPGNVYLGLVHRLDRPTGGIMVFARTSKSASRLSESIRNGAFSKEYLAIVCGKLKKDKDTLENYILKLPDNSSKITTKEKGKYASLSYEVLDYKEDLSLVKIKLNTGRHHQIRVQFKNIHHPLYGDQRYGINDKKQLALYACSIKFIHPVTKKEMCFYKNPPKEGVWKLFIN